MHARPAAVLAAQAKRYSADVRLVRGDREANAKSMVAVLALSLAHGDMVRVKAAGADAVLAAEALAELLAAGCGEDPAEAPVQSGQGQPGRAQPGPSGSSPAPSAPAASPEPGLFAGIAASPGLALGPVVRYLAREPEVAEEGQGPERELARLEGALAEARAQIETLKHQPGDAGRAHILDAHLELLDDPELTGQAKAGLSAGRSAAFAWREAFRAQAAVLEGLDNALLRERAGDLRDVGRRVLSLLAKGGRAMPEFTGKAVLVAEELAPSEAAALDRSKILGFATCRGGATGHVAILARSLGLAAVCGLDRAVLDIPEGAEVLLDGDRGTLRLNPGAEAKAEAARRMAEMAERRERELAAASALAHTADGHRVEVAANVVTAEDARQAVENGGEGVGLLRSEFLFEDRDAAPDEEEQAAAYLAVARVLGPGRRLVIRTMDVGGDKPLSYLPLPREDNPFLGLRGLRVSLDRPDLFRTQLRAILRCAGESDLHLMFPMVASLDELRAAKRHVAAVQAELGVAAKVGVMIEVPSAAILAEALAPEADFFSIGSNDLTQYTLAMDRGHPRLAKQADALHPAVLRLIGLTCEAAHRHGKWTGVCGGLASDLAAVPVLVGLGVDELSVAVPSIPAVKAAVARRTLEECRSLAREVCALATSGEVRARLAALAD
jgi:phosphocarrier protein FPr/phosphocarrier protein